MDLAKKHLSVSSLNHINSLENKQLSSREKKNLNVIQELLHKIDSLEDSNTGQIAALNKRLMVENNFWSDRFEYDAKKLFCRWIRCWTVEEYKSLKKETHEFLEEYDHLKMTGEMVYK